ncbi:MAG: hypothetical protein N0E44_18795 [Candidatus Thiodiazotropha lotti]|nr:hypothetical protein [Candidatus Thiodiazotropha lotti]MCW4221933.1 hypothetical protein [Candidatus Thiodiazotropha lotti]
MRDIDKYIWIPILFAVVGLGLPGLFVDFAEDSWQERIWIGMFSAMAMFSYVTFKKVGAKYPGLRNWGIHTYTGATITLFFGGLLASTLSVLFAMLPLPIWLHIFISLVLVVFAVGILINTR